MEEKKIPKEIRMITCGMSKHIHNSRPATFPHHPPTHGVQQWKVFTYVRGGIFARDRWDFARRTLRERDFARRIFCEKGILREGHFARKGFWEKNESDSRIWRMNRLIDFSNPLNQKWSIRVKRFPKSLAKEDYFYSIDLISITYVRARAQISRICKFGVLLYVHRTDGYKINKFNKKEWNTKIIKYIISNFYHK